jgi:uncharacterized protein YjbI with pentapeptide repeats
MDFRIHGATIHDATIHGATIHGAIIHGATIHDATIHGATIHGATIKIIQQRSLFKFIKTTTTSTLWFYECNYII